MANPSLYDEYLNSGDAGIGAALSAAMGAASSGPSPRPRVATYKKPDKNAPEPEPTPTPTPPIPNPPQSNFPAANQFQPLNNTSFATGAPINTPQQNGINVVNGTLNQIPIGGFGLGALSQAGYSRSPQVDMSNFLNQTSVNQPTMTGYKWNAGTGGVSGGNNDLLRQYYSDGTTRSFTGGVENNQPLAPTQYAAPLLNGERSPFSDPSVGALRNAQRSTNIYGQQVVNPSGGGQIISGIGPTVGFLGNARSINKDTGAQTINTPSGGTIISGPARGGPPQNNNQYADIYRGGWMKGGRY